MKKTTELKHLSNNIKSLLGPDCRGLSPSHIKTSYEALTLLTYPGSIVRVLTLLRDHPVTAFQQLVDIAGVDHLPRKPRFDVVYHLLSVTNNHRLQVVVPMAEGTCLASVTSVYQSAGWAEREIWDLYGVWFENHPDLRRLLSDYSMEGHPLRKDFPLTGYVEVHYDTSLRRVVYAPVHLDQPYREFDFLSQWERLLPGDEKAKKDADQ